MAKDPAFLFYPGDWMGGTMVLSRHLKGCYIDLLIAQFNNGPLSLESIKTILGQDQASWTVLSTKFKQDSEGNYFNERLVTEIEKREKFCQSRRNNIKSRYSNPTYEDTSVEHMNIHMENRNENRNENYLWINEKKLFLNSYQWKEKFCLEKKIEISFLEKAMNEFINDQELKENFTNLKELKNHFTNWFNKNKKNGIISKNDAGSTKLGTSAARVEALKNWSIGGKISESS